jgi:hypothetical protein
MKQILFIFGKETSARIDNKLDVSMQTIALERAGLSNENTVNQLIQGLIPIKLTPTIQGILKDKHKTQDCITSIMTELRQFLFRIWQSRCKEFTEWETSEGISRKNKRYSKYLNHHPKTHQTSNSTHEINNKVKDFMDSHIRTGNTLLNIYSTSGAVAR